MNYSFEQLQEDILSLGPVTSGLREYTPRALWPQIQLDSSDQSFTIDPNTPEAAAYEYFLKKYGIQEGPGIAARFFAIHNFVTTNLHKLERRGLLRDDTASHVLAEDLLYFLLTCFTEDETNHIPHSIYDSGHGLQLPFQDIMADFHRLRALRRRLKSVDS